MAARRTGSPGTVKGVKKTTMINKMRTAQEAVAGIQDGMTVMVGGFLGTGTPEILIDALVEKIGRAHV